MELEEFEYCWIAIAKEQIKENWVKDYLLAVIKDYESAFDTVTLYTFNLTNWRQFFMRLSFRESRTML